MNWKNWDTMVPVSFIWEALISIKAFHIAAKVHLAPKYASAVATLFQREKFLLKYLFYQNLLETCYHLTKEV